mmetsp:Transcript_5651/g.12403  ORF Transcript_5651/g.12403 Transcript_5651/m.12403 type:complete len:248 (+) Transcript_5651:297-1040(+)
MPLLLRIVAHAPVLHHAVRPLERIRRTQDAKLQRPFVERFQHRGRRPLRIPAGVERSRVRVLVEVVPRRSSAAVGRRATSLLLRIVVPVPVQYRSGTRRRVHVPRAPDHPLGQVLARHPQDREVEVRVDAVPLDGFYRHLSPEVSRVDARQGQAEAAYVPPREFVPAEVVPVLVGASLLAEGGVGEGPYPLGDGTGHPAPSVGDLNCDILGALGDHHLDGREGRRIVYPPVRIAVVFGVIFFLRIGA